MADEPWFLMSWREWLACGYRSRPGRMIELTDMPTVLSSAQGDGHWYWLAGANHQVYVHDKAWIQWGELEMRLLKLEWPDVTFTLPKGK